VFRQEADEELIYMQPPQLGFTTGEGTSTNRLLTETDSFVIAETGGVQTYIADDEIDVEIQYQGVYTEAKDTSNALLMSSLLVGIILLAI
jgi:hypothetical protein